MEPSGRLFLACWSAMLAGFGLWLTFWPRSYWNTWKARLKGGDPFERFFPGRTQALLAPTRRQDRNRRARWLGGILLAAALGGAAVALLLP